jgi:ABC-type transport system substrate-binding protein
MSRLAGGLVVWVLLAGCTHSGSEPLPTAVSPSPTVTSPNFVPPGLGLVFGAEGWPECLNPVTSCASSPWAWYTVLEHVLPRAMQLDPQGNLIGSPLLTEAPTLENGGLTRDPFTVTYHLNPLAIWEDETPITSKDFDFTWRAIEGTPGAVDKDVFHHIVDIDSRDPQTVVIAFDQVMTDWASLFGGSFGFVLEAAAFPQQAAERRPNLQNLMQDAIPFSGGPWALDRWSQQQAVLFRNDHYFGSASRLDKITFTPRTDQTNELLSLMAGEVSAIYPQPYESSLIEQCAGCRDVRAFGGDGTTVQVLWLDLTAAPLDDVLVRQALFYAMDRQAVVDQIAKLNNPYAEVLNCGLIATPSFGPWCRDQVFAKYGFEPNRARALLEEAGYDCSGSPCVKDGKPLRMKFRVLATNSVRVKAQRILIRGAREAGFDLVRRNFSISAFIELPACTRAVRPIGLCTMDVTSDPSVTDLFACDAIPSPENDYGGRNFSHWCNPQADLLMKAADRAIDPDVRLDLMTQVYALQAADAVALPLYAVPAVTVWRPDELAGPVGTWSGSPYGGFFNMNEWTLAGPT